MPSEPPQNQNDHLGEGSLGELPPLDFELTPEQPSNRPEVGQAEDLTIDLRLTLDAHIVKRQQAEIDELGQAKIEREQLHVLRTTSTRKLFILTVVWLSVIWLVLFLQGFGQWFLPYPYPGSDQEYLKFHLSDSVMIAFITSTTATVLGLYGIAAYWLYGKKPPSKSEKPNPDKKDDAED
ncbi:hypothetical protein ABEU86_20005 [Pseudomonas paraversuta]|uniref:hypothetical protein n=1 Tax=Pseudomonas paraversuta TaxID=2750624 RepID=UPI003D2D75F5